MLRCSDGSLYTGAAKDVGRRVAEHATGRASRYTRARLPVALVWSRRVRSWSLALKEEHRIKRLRRAAKEALMTRRRKVRSLAKGASCPGSPS
jgi:putative endonuclease